MRTRLGPIEHIEELGLQCGFVGEFDAWPQVQPFPHHHGQFDRAVSPLRCAVVLIRGFEPLFPTDVLVDPSVEEIGGRMHWCYLLTPHRVRVSARSSPRSSVSPTPQSGGSAERDP